MFQLIMLSSFDFFFFCNSRHLMLVYCSSWRIIYNRYYHIFNSTCKSIEPFQWNQMECTDVAHIQMYRHILLSHTVNCSRNFLRIKFLWISHSQTEMIIFFSYKLAANTNVIRSVLSAIAFDFSFSKNKSVMIEVNLLEILRECSGGWSNAIFRNQSSSCFAKIKVKLSTTV